MRSYTFSSERDVPKVRWGAAWLLCAVVVVSCLSGWEALLRKSGYDAGMKADNAALWAAARRSVRGGDPYQYVLIGDSRMQQDVDPDEFARALGGRARAAQLAIAGSRELPLLEDIARDEAFKGVVVFAVNPARMTKKFLDDTEGVQGAEDSASSGRDRADDYVAYYKNETPSRRADAAFSRLFAGRAMFPGSLDTGLKHLKSGKGGAGVKRSRYGKRGIKIHGNRWVAADYDSDWARARRNRGGRQYDEHDRISNEEVDSYIRILLPLINKIKKRGGRVILVRLPSSGHMLELENALYPRAETWDRLVDETKTMSIHFEDFPKLSKFVCGDANHLDMRDAPEFSRSLARIVAEKQ